MAAELYAKLLAWCSICVLPLQTNLLAVVQDFKLWLTESPTSSYFTELYPGTEIHAGFLEQFQEVASNSVRLLVPLCSSGQGHAWRASLGSLAAFSCFPRRACAAAQSYV